MAGGEGALQQTGLPQEERASALVVGDDPARLTSLASAISEMGLDVATALPAGETLSSLLERSFALILLDASTQTIDGYETAKIIRSRPGSAQTPIIFVTAGTPAAEECLKGYSIGATDWVSLPIVPEILRAKAKVFLDLYDLNRVARRQAEELTLLNDALAQRTSQLEAVSKELDSFSHSVSHDLRPPLRAVDGFSRILREEYSGSLDAKGKQLLDLVCDNAAMLGRLIDDMLAFSRTGRMEMAATEVDMEALARHAWEEFTPLVAGRKLELDLQRLPPAWGDRAMLRQVMTNLLSNAVKFTRPKEAASIEVGGAVDGKEVVYHVKDNGVGFDMRYAGRLFGVFQRLHRQDEFEGNGIGLAIVRRIIARHGGRVWAEGKVGEGAVAYFALPIKEEQHKCDC